jgi:hypothetical protein
MGVVVATDIPGKHQSGKNTQTTGKGCDSAIAPESAGRRRFIAGVGAVTAALSTGVLAPLVGASYAGAREASNLPPPKPGGGNPRVIESFEIRSEAALAEAAVPVPGHPNNGDETLYPNRVGNYSKGLPHNSLGEVNPNAYNALLKAVSTGKPSDFNLIPLGGTVPLVDPQSGLAFDIEGTDSHQLAIPPAPSLASARLADNAVENYWMALLRDVPFSEYDSDPTAAEAIAELDALPNFTGPRDPNTGHITAGTLFRGYTPGDLTGPYISQFLYQPLSYGAIGITQQFQTDVAGVDFMTTFADWLAVQNGQAPFPPRQLDSQPRHLRNGRDISAYVHVDVLFEAYLNACLYLIDLPAPLNPGNPYLQTPNQSGFGTFGSPHVKAMVAEVATRALKAVWYQKWFVHRALRPEAYGGLVHNTLRGARTYPLHSDILNSKAVKEVFANSGTYLLPHAFPEGCPQHPSYGQGHGTVGGACVTILKAFFDGTFVIPNPVMASSDGLSLQPYTGVDADQITVGGELNKIAANIAIGRNHAAVHWRSDYEASLPLGEAIAISVLRDQRPTYNEKFQGFTFTKFDGTKITV